MQNSTWNDTNQHWIPQFLLKGFGKKGDASRIFQLDKQTGKISERDVEDVASKKQLLSERDDELLKDTEVRTARVLGKIRKRKLDIKPEQRRCLDSMVYLMILNDPYSGIDRRTARESSVQKVSSEIEGALNRWGASIDSQQLNEWLEGSFNHDYLNIAMERDHNLVLTALNLMGLSVFEPPLGEFLVIGDSPVLVVRGTHNGETSLLNPGSQVILPIHSKCLLVYSWDVSTNLIEFGGTLVQEQVRSLNADYFLNTDCRYVFGRNHADLKRAQKHQQRNAASRPTEVKDGWRIMRLEQQVASMSDAQRHAKFKTNLDLIARESVKRALEDDSIASE